MIRIERALSRVENLVAAGTLGAAAVLAIVQIVLRNLFGIFIFWAEEAIIYLIIYSTFFGAIVTLRHNEHVNVDIIAAFLKRRGKQVMAMIALLVTLVYLGVVGYFAWLLIFEPFSRSTTTAALDLPLWTVELSVALGFTLMFMRALEMLFRIWRQGPQEESLEDVLDGEARVSGLDTETVRASRARIEGQGEPLENQDTEDKPDSDDPDAGDDRRDDEGGSRR